MAHGGVTGRRSRLSGDSSARHLSDCFGGGVQPARPLSLAVAAPERAHLTPQDGTGVVPPREAQEARRPVPAHARSLLKHQRCSAAELPEGVNATA